jgi:hypothetical protein
LITLSLFAALTMFSRLDLIFFAVLVGVWILFRGHSLRYYLPLDILSIAFSVLLAFTLKFGFPEYFEHDDAAATMIVVALIVRLGTAYLLGLYQNQSAEKPLKLLSRLGVFAIVSSVILGALMLVIARIFHFTAMPRTHRSNTLRTQRLACHFQSAEYGKSTRKYQEPLEAMANGRIHLLWDPCRTAWRVHALE